MFTDDSVANTPFMGVQDLDFTKLSKEELYAVQRYLVGLENTYRNWNLEPLPWITTRRTELHRLLETQR